MELTENAVEAWEVESNGQIFETNFDELSEWIRDGSVLRMDRVRKANLRWIEAGKVPSLLTFFNQKDAGGPPSPVITTTHKDELGCATALQPFDNVVAGGATGVCSMHPELMAAYACDTCVNSFCKTCPSGYGASVKICPFCGAMCRSLARAPVAAAVREERIRASIDESFGFGDFVKSLAFPFKFKTSLIFGSILFVFFSIGQGAGGFGGIFMIAGAIICFMAANMLTFGVLGNTIENFAQGKTEEDFMPSFDDFSIWDDVVHPLFLSIGVYLSSFGPFMVVAAIAVFYAISSVGGPMNSIQSDATRTVDPELPYAAKAASQSQAVRDLVNRAGNTQQLRVEAMERGEVPATLPGPRAVSLDEDASIDNMIRQQQAAQLESTLGKTPETKAQEDAAMMSKILGYGALLLIVGGITLLWGLVYFPAACAVAGYTRSFAATMNPSVGFDTIRRLGSSYVLLLVMGLILSVASGFLSGLFASLFSAFDLPSVGNVPAKILGGFTGFYLWVVWSCLLGYLLFKNSGKLKLAR